MAGLEQWRTLVTPHRVHTCPMLQQDLANVIMSHLAGNPQGCRPIRTGLIHRGVVLYQQGTDAPVTILGRNEKGRCAILHRYVDVRARIQKLFGHDYVSGLARYKQRSGPIIRARVHLGSCANENPCHFHVSFLGGKEECRRAGLKEKYRKLVKAIYLRDMDLPLAWH